jgi:hypothetical protein
MNFANGAGSKGDPGCTVVQFIIGAGNSWHGERNFFMDRFYITLNALTVFSIL